MKYIILFPKFPFKTDDTVMADGLLSSPARNAHAANDAFECHRSR